MHRSITVPFHRSSKSPPKSEARKWDTTRDRGVIVRIKIRAARGYVHTAKHGRG